jgi:site-specific DNA recombinase
MNRVPGNGAKDARQVVGARAHVGGQAREGQGPVGVLDDEVHRAPNPALLDQLPVTSVDLADMPDEISRQLFEALRLEIRYDFTTHVATCEITLSGDTIDAVARTSQAELDELPPPAERND